MKRIAMVFPGQGSQYVGMLQDVALQFPEVEENFKSASVVLGYDLWQLVQKGSEEKLSQTVYTQPALLVAGVAIYKILEKKGIKAEFFAGHSLGEYTALVCAGALDFNDAVKLVAARGRYMQEAVPQGVGGMAAIIGLDDDVVESICKAACTANEIVSAANYNSVGQTVIAGHLIAVGRAMHGAKNKGAKMVVPLPVSVPSHCELMQPAAIRLAATLADISFQHPSVPVISNVDVTAYQSAEEIRAGLVRQLSQPVRWVQTIQHFIHSGITTIIECGPGKVLTGLSKRIDKNLELITTTDLASLERIA